MSTTFKKTKRWEENALASILFANSYSNVNSTDQEYTIGRPHDPNDLEEELVAQIQPLYEIPNPDEVGRFLLAHPQLLELLLEAPEHIREQFGPCTVSLKVFRDPELLEDKDLVAYIHTTLPIGEALVKLDALDEEWLVDQADISMGRFNFLLASA
jgi:hypothetical protein